MQLFKAIFIITPPLKNNDFHPGNREPIVVNESPGDCRFVEAY